MSDTLTKPGSKKSKEKFSVKVKVKGGRARKSDGGLFRYWVSGSRGKNAAWEFSPDQLIEVIRIGVPVQELRVLQASLDVPVEQLVPMLGISKATLHRRMAGGKLGSAESERVVRFARLMGKAVDVFESEENARRWLRSPQFGLGGAVPLVYAETEVGAREVEDLLGRIEYGVYS